MEIAAGGRVDTGMVGNLRRPGRHGRTTWLLSESLPYMYLACRKPEDAGETRPLSRVHASALSAFVVWQDHAALGDETVILDSRGRVQAAAELASSSAQ